jgi:hypothetical protein
MKRHNWYGLYRERWANDIVPEAMTHPAKFSRALIRRVYRHAVENGWIGEGSRIIDPFGGVALGALDAMTLGMSWVGIEIEPKFVLLGQGGECDGKTSLKESGETLLGWYIRSPSGDHVGLDGVLWIGEPEGNGFADKQTAAEYMKENIPSDEADTCEIVYLETLGKGDVIPAMCGKKVDHEPHYVQGNIEYWNKKYAGKLQKWGSARLIQGDSRKLANVLHDAGLFDAAASSPPFLAQGGGSKVAETGVLSDPRLRDRHAAGNVALHAYGDEEGNIAYLPDEGIDGAISSPPFQGQSADGGWQMLGKYASEGKLTVEQVGGDPTKSYPSWDKERDTSYGETPGQLADLPAGEVDVALSSPPYSGIQVAKPNVGYSGQDDIEERKRLRSDGVWDGYNRGNEDNLANLPDEGYDSAIASPPYIDTGVGATHMTSSARLDPNSPNFRPSWVDKFAAGYNESRHEYGSSDGQLGEMPEGEADAALSSPPYAGARIDGAGDEGSSGVRMPDGSYPRGEEGWELRKDMGGRYGDQDGQLSGMGMSSFDAAASSPPFEGVTANRPSQQIMDSVERGEMSGFGPAQRGEGYGETDGNIGETYGEDFWTASRLILDNLYYLLKPGGVAIFVLKRYVKGGKLVYFPRQWAKVCRAAGFRLIEWNRAWVVEDRGAQYDLFGNLQTKTVERKSFFRRLAEKKGSPRIDWEDVLVLVKETKRKD